MGTSAISFFNFGRKPRENPDTVGLLEAQASHRLSPRILSKPLVQGSLQGLVARRGLFFAFRAAYRFSRLFVLPKRADPADSANVYRPALFYTAAGTAQTDASVRFRLHGSAQLGQCCLHGFAAGFNRAFARPEVRAGDTHQLGPDHHIGAL